MSDGQVTVFDNASAAELRQLVDGADASKLVLCSYERGDGLVFESLQGGGSLFIAREHLPCLLSAVESQLKQQRLFQKLDLYPTF